MHDPNLLLPAARRAAATIVKSGVLADEAAERAVHKLHLITLAGTPPRNPLAWVRVVARRSAIALLRKGWGCTAPSDVDLVARDAPPWDKDRGEQRTRYVDFVREQVAPSLSRRQRDALDATLTTHSLKAAAASCGMQPRDYRRSLRAITHKARRCLSAAAEDLPGGTGIQPPTRSS